MAGFTSRRQRTGLPAFAGRAPTRGARVNAPTFATPDTSALNALRGRGAALQGTIDNPLGSAGVQGTLTSLNTGLVRRAQAARGQAMGRATTSGQAGFAGSMAQSGANIEGQLGDAMAQGQTDLVSSVLKDANAEMSTNLSNRGNIETENNRQALDQSRILAEVAAQNAQLDADYYRADQEYLSQQESRILDWETEQDRLDQEYSRNQETDAMRERERAADLLERTGNTAYERRTNGENTAWTQRMQEQEARQRTEQLAYERERALGRDKASDTQQSFQNDMARLGTAGSLDGGSRDEDAFSELFRRAGIPYRTGGRRYPGSSTTRDPNKKKGRTGFYKGEQ